MELLQIALLAFLTISCSGQRRCPANQVWKDCGTANPLVCGIQRDETFPERCVSECSCPDGLWLKTDGSCVRSEKECDCTANQVWKDCGTACPLICGQEAPEICTKECVPGCQCPDGFWRRSDGSCVRRQDQCDVTGHDCDDQGNGDCHNNGVCLRRIVGTGYRCTCNRGCYGYTCQRCRK